MEYYKQRYRPTDPTASEKGREAGNAACTNAECLTGVSGKRSMNCVISTAEEIAQSSLALLSQM